MYFALSYFYIKVVVAWTLASRRPPQKINLYQRHHQQTKKISTPTMVVGAKVPKYTAALS